MRFASALSTKSDWTDAVEDLALQIRAQLGTGQTDLGLMFVHSAFVPDIEHLVDTAEKAVGVRHLLGCTGGGIIGAEREIENQPAISFLAAELPSVQIRPFHITEKDMEESRSPGFWHLELDLEPGAKPNFIALVDPFTVRAMDFVDGLSEAYPAAPVVGGLVSGGEQPGENRLFVGGEVMEEGAVGVALTGNITVHTIVSQGCKPIGRPLVVTRADKNILFELGGQPPLKVLQEMVPQLASRDQQLVRNALFLGRVINEYQEEYGRGDFLIRNLLGSDPQSGALAVGDFMRTGQTVQFHVRDADAADEDLRQLLARQKKKLLEAPAQGAVLFSCLGRGEGMYGKPHHDINVVHQNLGAVPTAGFFCNGEIGPVGERTFIHGFTSVIGVFTESGK